MDRQEYDKKIQKQFQKNNYLDVFEKVSKKFNLKFDKEKYLKPKFKKSSYYDDDKYSELARYFTFCYSLLCKKWIIDLPSKIKELNKTGHYDIDVITLLCIFKRMWEAQWTTRKKIRNSDLILLWWILFDNKIQKEKKRWKDDMWELLKNIKKKKPSDYDNFFNEKDYKYLDKNSFQKYKRRLDSEKIKVFMTEIFETCEELAPSMREISISDFFEVWFYIYVCNLKLDWLKKYKDLKYNYDVIQRILSKSWEKKDLKSNNSRVLDYIYKYYTDAFYKSFLKK